LRLLALDDAAFDAFQRFEFLFQLLGARLLRFGFIFLFAMLGDLR
jgi:hypothetical protein